MDKQISKTTDSGKTKAGFSFEKNDCTVRAYASALNIPYMNAFWDLAVNGRKHNKGFHIDQFYTEKFGNPLPCPNMTVERFIKTVIPFGRYIVYVRGHVFAVIDGVINDLNPAFQLNRHVLKAWHVTNYNK